jgi:hypothetical protein
MQGEGDPGGVWGNPFGGRGPPRCQTPSPPCPASSPNARRRPEAAQSRALAALVAFPITTPQASRESYAPRNFPGAGRRCAYFEPHSKSDLWITADANVTLPVGNASYYLVSFLDGRRSTGRYTVAVSDWAETEDFRRPYAPPAGARNVSWDDPAAAAACCGGGGAAAAGGNFSACPPFSGFGGCGPALEGGLWPRSAAAAPATGTGNGLQ